MFNSLQPPLLVQPISMRQVTMFPSHEGYCIHYLNSEQALVCYRDGWTFPLSAQQQRFVSMPPLLLLKESGCITSASSTVVKGYSHQFCQDNGKDVIYQSKQTLFPDQPEEMWMLVQNTATMIWLQYGNKNQFCGGSGYEMERIFFGKLLIRKFVIKEDLQPRLGKDAADKTTGAKQYRVGSYQLYNDYWSLADLDTSEYLRELLKSQNLERFHTAVSIALKRAGYPN